MKKERATCQQSEAVPEEFGGRSRLTGVHCSSCSTDKLSSVHAGLSGDEGDPSAGLESSFADEHERIDELQGRRRLLVLQEDWSNSVELLHLVVVRGADKDAGAFSGDLVGAAGSDLSEEQVHDPFPD